MSKLLLDVLAKECIVEDAARAIHEENIKPFENFFTYFCQIHGLPNNTISSYNGDMIAVLQDVYSNISLEDPSDEREYTRRKQEQQRYVLSLVPMLRLALTRSEHVLESTETTTREVAQTESGSKCDTSSPDKEIAVATLLSPGKPEHGNNASPATTKPVSEVVRRTPVSTKTPIANSDSVPSNVVPPSPPLTTRSNRSTKSATNAPAPKHHHLSSKAPPPPQPSHLRTPIKSNEKRITIKSTSNIVSPTKSNRTPTQTARTPTSATRNRVSSPANTPSSRLSIATKTSPQTPGNPSTARSPSSVVSPDITSASLLSPSQERAFRKLSSGSISSSNSANNNSSNSKKLSPAMEQVKRQQAAKDYYNQLSRSRKPEEGAIIKAYLSDT